MFEAEIDHQRLNEDMIGAEDLVNCLLFIQTTAWDPMLLQVHLFFTISALTWASVSNTFVQFLH